MVKRKNKKTNAFSLLKPEIRKKCPYCSKTYHKNDINNLQWHIEDKHKKEIDDFSLKLPQIQKKPNKNKPQLKKIKPRNKKNNKPKEKETNEGKLYNIRSIFWKMQRCYEYELVPTKKKKKMVKQSQIAAIPFKSMEKKIT